MGRAQTLTERETADTVGERVREEKEEREQEISRRERKEKEGGREGEGERGKEHVKEERSVKKEGREREKERKKLKRDTFWTESVRCDHRRQVLRNRRFSSCATWSCVD